MKINKKFVDLIYKGEKKYEIRNSGDKEGFYKIKDKYFKLDCFERVSILKNQYIQNEIPTFFEKLDKQSQKGVLENRNYFKNENCYVYFFYKGVEINFKELEIIEDVPKLVTKKIMENSIAEIKEIDINGFKGKIEEKDLIELFENKTFKELGKKFGDK